MKLATLGILFIGTAAFAQVPPAIAKQLVNIGRGVCVPETAEVYRPLHPNPPYAGVLIERNISFGPNAQDVADVFSAEKGGGNRPVLIYIPGGAGNKLQGGPNGDVFYDNVMLWATKNGMVGVNMQRHAGPNWDDPAKDVARLVQWVGANIAKYKGNPNRVFMWSQSAGNGPASTYIAHSELHGPKGVGLKGAVFMSSPGFSILPVTPPAVQGATGPCGRPDGSPAPAVAAKGGDGKAGKGGGGKGGGAAKGKAAPEQPDQAALLARSNLAGLSKSKVAFFISAAELDSPSVIVFAETLRDELTKAGRKPTYMLFKDHSHISEVLSPNTADTSVTAPILKWMKSVK